MYITLNFTLLFLTIILPGIIFRRTYYYGEFSKQFRIKEPLHHLFISNIIPGIVFLLLSLFILRLLNWISPILVLYTKVRISTQELSTLDSSLLDNKFFDDMYFITSTTFLLAFLVGYITSRTIRLLRLDLRYNFLRYKNSWYYLFSGEISNFEKFKRNLPIRKTIIKRKAFYPLLVDILIDQDSDKTLYSGILIDYEISQDNLLRLERVYLKDAQRYNRSKKKIVSINIPGDLFVLNTRNLINLNINYPKETHSDKLKRKESKEKIFNLISIFLGILSLIMFIIYIYSLFFNIGLQLYDSNKWHGKMLLLILGFQIISVFNPKEIEFKNESKKKLIFYWKNILIKMLRILFWGLIYYLIYLY